MHFPAISLLLGGRVSLSHFVIIVSMYQSTEALDQCWILDQSQKSEGPLCESSHLLFYHFAEWHDPKSLRVVHCQLLFLSSAFSISGQFFLPA